MWLITLFISGWLWWGLGSVLKIDIIVTRLVIVILATISITTIKYSTTIIDTTR